MIKKIYHTDYDLNVVSVEKRIELVGFVIWRQVTVY